MVAKEKGIPVVLATPVGALEVFPYGSGSDAQESWEQGMVASDYEERIAALRSALDLEVFRYYVVAKTDQRDLIRSLERPGVFVLDLERELMARGFDFGFSDPGFSDQVHFSGDLHRLVAEIIGRFLLDKGICWEW